MQRHLSHVQLQGRIEIDLIPIAQELEAYIENIKAPITVAILGCGVNGPGGSA